MRAYVETERESCAYNYVYYLSILRVCCCGFGSSQGGVLGFRV